MSREPGRILGDWVLWDGSCGFCAHWANWVERRNETAGFRVVPFTEAPDPPARPDLRDRATATVLVVTTDGRTLERTRAVVHVLRGLGHPWAVPLAWPPLVWLGDLGYRLVAANRGRLSRWFGLEACAVSKPE